MTTEKAREQFEEAIARHIANGNTEGADNVRLMMEFLTNEDFRQKLGDFTYSQQK